MLAHDGHAYATSVPGLLLQTWRGYAGLTAYCQLTPPPSTLSSLAQRPSPRTGSLVLTSSALHTSCPCWRLCAPTRPQSRCAAAFTSCACVLCGSHVGAYLGMSVRADPTSFMQHPMAIAVSNEAGSHESSMSQVPFC